jgi:hypothetical protein
MSTRKSSSNSMSDDPGNLMVTVGRMSGLAVGSQRTHGWWATAAGVQALAEVAAEDTPLGRVAMVGLQIVATKYNEMTRGDHDRARAVRPHQ